MPSFALLLSFPLSVCLVEQKYDALLVRSGTQVTEKVIRAGSKLRVIGRAGVGVDNIHVQSATDQGVLVVK